MHSPIFPALTLYESRVEAVSDLSSPGVCASCSFFTDSTAEGCAIELKSDQYSFTFNMSRHNGELVLLECFPVPEAGVFSVYVYEVQYGEIQTHVYNELHDVIIKKTESEKNCCSLFTMYNKHSFIPVQIPH